MRTGIYLRISQARRDKDADDGSRDEAGINRQREDCLALADQLGWQVVEIYPENDTSASSRKPREHYRRMLADIEAGRIDAIIAWHTDRLYRRLSDLEELAKIRAKHHVAIQTCRSGEIDLSTPTGQLIAEILGSVAKHEVAQKADRWKRSYQQRREAGQWMGGAPRTFGYNTDGSQRPDEAEILQRVARSILDGSTIYGECRRLDDDGVRTTRGNPWEPSALRKLLSNPRIAGLSVLDDQILGAGKWEPILDRETWELVRSAVDTKTHRQAAHRRALLSGLAFCGIEGCGKRLYRSMKSIRIYGCKTSAWATGGHVAIAAGPLEEMVESYARMKLSDDRVRAGIAARLVGGSSAATQITREIDRLEGEIRDLEAALSESGSRSKLAIARSIDDLDDQLQVQRSRMSTIIPVALPVGDEWPDDLDRRSALIRLVVKRVVVYPAKRRGGRFDPDRVYIDPVSVEQREDLPDALA